MITQNELRIGNIIKSYLTGEIVHTDWLVIKHISDGNYQNSYHTDKPVYEPIPITDKWLIRLGFEKTEAEFQWQLFPVWMDQSKSFVVTCFDVDTDAPYYNLVGTNDDMKNSHCIGTEILYIHQLQNLCFALTGKELELKQNA